MGLKRWGSWGKKFMKSKVKEQPTERYHEYMLRRTKEENAKERAKMDKNFNGKSYVKDGIESDF